MSKINEITLHINKPCNADWNSMNPTDKGKFCKHCAKQVFDATNLLPEGIFAILKEYKGNACMRMTKEMLDTPLSIRIPPWYSSLTKYYKKIALFIGMQFLFFNQIKAQLAKAILNDRSRNGVVKKYMKSIIIYGTVMDSDAGAPMPDIKVLVRKHDKIIARALTKSDGTYILTMNDSIEDNALASIEFIQPMHPIGTIIQFSFNKPVITIDTVYLDKNYHYCPTKII